ncbi:hypothetical protein SARC_02432 [Sphaeroforma arctica JP610]|uniref:Uncharacterized protein n=1 Tax=Sphaeroforma arctica JP610 TaxID=667725 RepID=A0A0L0G8Y8_9EUKA|nr:hypothetical protein SARC_02432 [Sphaeroforma arctica JP610]KNC85374.1 hypothetical protein SARC_02432 [Sphaeroforma arctica JP610]|eukprot:XP_014159276.1 hypothetical protein SARC_02432 [Sphaeroforma arctica JP610]
MNDGATTDKAAADKAAHDKAAADKGRSLSCPSLLKEEIATSHKRYADLNNRYDLQASQIQLLATNQVSTTTPKTKEEMKRELCECQPRNPNKFKEKTKSDLVTFEAIANDSHYQWHLCELQHGRPLKCSQIDNYKDHTRLSQVNSDKLAGSVGTSTFNHNSAYCMQCKCEGSYCIGYTQISTTTLNRRGDRNQDRNGRNTNGANDRISIPNIEKCNLWNLGVCKRYPYRYRHECNIHDCETPTNATSMTAKLQRAQC